jgi:hypothetical protein
MSTTKQATSLDFIALLVISSLQHAHATRDPEKRPGPGEKCAHPSCEQLKATTNSALTKVIWPTSANIALSGNPPPEFSVDVRGRIVPVGNFEVSSAQRSTVQCCATIPSKPMVPWPPCGAQLVRLQWSLPPAAAAHVVQLI